MAKRSNGLFSGLLFLLVFLFLVALNPTRDEFIAWMSAKQADAAAGEATSSLIGEIGKGAGGAVEVIEGGVFHRHSYTLFSLFSKDGGKVVYLGAAKLFVRLK
ncbi:MAG: hypothetical protein ACLQMF_14870 [Rectinemataceae bacterium]